MANMRPTLNRCPKLTDHGGPCPAYLDVDDDAGVAVCKDHGIVARVADHSAASDDPPETFTYGQTGERGG